MSPSSPPRRTFGGERAWTAVLLGLAVLAASSPLLIHGFPRGHDWVHELVRVAQMRAALADGQLPAAWAPDLYSGFGSPIFLFYAPLFSLLASGLGVLLGGGVATGATVTLAAASGVAALGGGRLVRAALHPGDGRASWAHRACWGTGERVGGVLFALSPYLLADGLLRNACAELLALALLPFAIAALLDLRRRPAAAWPALAVATMLVVLAHNLTAMLMVGMVVAAGMVVLGLRRRALLAAGGGLLLGLALAAWFWLPALWLSPLVRVEELHRRHLDFRQAFPAPNELFGHGAFHSPGWLAPLALLGVAAALLAGRLGRRHRRRVALAATGGGLLLVLLQLRAATSLWEALPALHLLQFPWRLNGPLALCGAVAGGLAAATFAARLPTAARRALEVAVLLAALLDAAPVLLAARPLPDEVRRSLAWGLAPEQVRAVGRRATVFHEWLPRSADPTLSSRPRPAVLSAPAEAAVDAVRQSGSRLSMRVAAPSGGSLALARWAFPGWRVRVDGEAAMARVGPGGTLAVELPPGEHHLRVEYRQPAVRWVGIASAAGAAVLFVALRRWRSVGSAARRGAGGRPWYVARGYAERGLVARSGDVGPRRWWLSTALLATAAVAGTVQVRDGDAFWHLAAGRWILAHGQLPRHDPFRFTSGGAPWIDHEWGFQLLLAGLERLGGIAALSAFAAAFAVALAALLLRLMRRMRTPPPAAVLLTLTAVLGARARFNLRPEMASMLLLVVLLTALQALRERPTLARFAMGPLLTVPLLVTLWASLHPGALIAPVVTLLYLVGWRLGTAGSWAGSGALSLGAPGAEVAAAGAAPETDPPPPPRRSGPPPWTLVAGLPLLCGAALLANPYGWKVLLVPAQIRAALAHLPAVNPDWSPLWRAPRPGFVLFVLLVGVLAVAAGRRGKPPDPALALTALGLLPLGILGVRHLPLVWLAAALLGADAVARLHEAGVRWASARLQPRLLAGVACLLAALFCLHPPSRGPLSPRGAHPRFGAGVQGGLYPQGAVDELGRWSRVGNLYNDVVFGGYLLWRLYPPRRIFVDSRNELHPALLRELAAGRGDSRRWQELLRRYDVDGAVVRYRARLLPVVDPGRAGAVQHLPESALYFPREQFALVHWDDVAMLYLRRAPGRAAELRAREYRWVEPEDPAGTLRRAAADPRYRSRVLLELHRKLAEEPTCRRARELLAGLARDAGVEAELIADP